MNTTLLPLRFYRTVFLFPTICLLWTHHCAAETSQAGRHFLWRVSNAAAPFYLLGSMHTLRATDYPLGSNIDRAIEESKRFLYEHDIEHADPDISDRKIRDAARLPSGVTFQQKVKPETFIRVQKALKDKRTSEFNDVRPWAIAYFMLEGPAMANFNAKLSVERYVYQKAGRAEIAGLETFNEFVRSVSEMNDAESEAFLLETIAYSERLPRLLVETIEAWKSGNAQRMYQLYAPRAGEPGGYWGWIEKRNSPWIPRIEQAVQSGKPTMVVVGALHFCGPKSIIAMLQKRGYRIEQL